MDSLSIVPQRRRMDCGIAALAMLLGVPYEDVYVAACAVAPNHVRKGLGIGEMQGIAGTFGVRLARLRSYDIDSDVGVLSVRGKARGRKREFWHYVVLRNGDVIDPDGGTIVDAADYFSANRARPCTLLATEG